jgi:hypothetical protein
MGDRELFFEDRIDAMGDDPRRDWRSGRRRSPSCSMLARGLRQLLRALKGCNDDPFWIRRCGFLPHTSAAEAGEDRGFGFHSPARRGAARVQPMLGFAKCRHRHRLSRISAMQARASCSGNRDRQKEGIKVVPRSLIARSLQEGLDLQIRSSPGGGDLGRAKVKLNYLVGDDRDPARATADEIAIGRVLQQL